MKEYVMTIFSAIYLILSYNVVFCSPDLLFDAVWFVLHRLHYLIVRFYVNRIKILILISTILALVTWMVLAGSVACAADACAASKILGVITPNMGSWWRRNDSKSDICQNLRPLPLAWCGCEAAQGSRTPSASPDGEQWGGLG